MIISRLLKVPWFCFRPFSVAPAVRSYTHCCIHSFRNSTSLSKRMSGRKIPPKVLELVSKHVPKEDKVAVLYFFAVDPNADRFVQVLESVLETEDVFAALVKQLVQDVSYLKQDEGFRNIMINLWENYLISSSNGTDVEASQFSLQLNASNQGKSHVASGVAILEVIANMPPASQQQVISAISKAAILPGFGAVITKQADTLLSLRAAGGKMVSIGLVAAYLSWEAYKSIHMWWKGEISGARCAKNIIDSTLSTAAGVGGGICGASIGTALLPGLGTVIGGIVGGAVAANVAAAISDMLTRTLFDLPKEVALENAYRFLELPTSASIREINSRYRQLALKYHPDKGGEREDWEKLQCSMGIIKASKEN